MGTITPNNSPLRYSPPNNSPLRNKIPPNSFQSLSGLEAGTTDSHCLRQCSWDLRSQGCLRALRALNRARPGARPRPRKGWNPEGISARGMERYQTRAFGSCLGGSLRLPQGILPLPKATGGGQKALRAFCPQGIEGGRRPPSSGGKKPPYGGFYSTLLGGLRPRILLWRILFSLSLLHPE